MLDKILRLFFPMFFSEPKKEETIVEYLAGKTTQKKRGRPGKVKKKK